MTDAPDRGAPPPPVRPPPVAMTFQPGNAAVEAGLRTWAIVVWALLIASAFTFALTAVVALILAYIKRPEAVGTVFESHFTSAIRTFWISVVVFAVGIVLTLVLVGIAVLVALFVWQLFRTIRGIVYAIDGKPIAHSRGWL